MPQDGVSPCDFFTFWFLLGFVPSAMTSLQFVTEGQSTTNDSFCDFSREFIQCATDVTFSSVNFKQFSESCLLQFEGNPDRNVSLDFDGMPSTLTVSSPQLQQFTITSDTLTTLDFSNNHLQMLVDSKIYARNLTSLILKRNHLSEFPVNVLQNTSQLKVLDLSHNRIIWIHLQKDGHVEASLKELILDHNLITELSWVSILPAESLSLLHNPVMNSSLPLSRYLLSLRLSHAPFTTISPFSFVNVENLQNLTLTYLPRLSSIRSNSLYGLEQLTLLNVSHNSKLCYIHKEAFATLMSLQVVDLRNNSLLYLYAFMFPSVSCIALAGNPWMCSNDLPWFESLQNTTTDDPHCVEQDGTSQTTSLKLCVPAKNCQLAKLQIKTYIFLPLGKTAVIGCPVFTPKFLNLTWVLPSGEDLVYENGYAEYIPYLGDHSDHPWHQSTGYKDNFEDLDERLHILPNGSLHIDYVVRSDTGKYTCFGDISDNETSAIILVRLDYNILFTVTLNCVIVAFSTAATCMLAGIIICLSNHMAYKFSPEEEAKRHRIRQVLQDLNNYSSEQMGRIHAYGSAKMDQISAFRSSKIDILRTYKTATLTNVLAYMHNMREQYSSQVGRIRFNCTAKRARLHQRYVHQTRRFKGYKTQQIDRLRGYRDETVGKLKDYKSEHMDKLRNNYSMQAQRIRDYGTQQVGKLREQYKLQQQYLLKLLELLDIGHCFTVIEEECRSTESEIFTSLDLNDAVVFDLDQLANYAEDHDGSMDSSLNDDSPEHRHEIIILEDMSWAPDLYDAEGDSDSQSSVYYSLPVSRTASPAKPQVLHKGTSELVLNPVYLPDNPFIISQTTEAAEL